MGRPSVASPEGAQPVAQRDLGGRRKQKNDPQEGCRSRGDASYDKTNGA